MGVDRCVPPGTTQLERQSGRRDLMRQRSRKYACALGARLRSIRVQQGLTLYDVEEKSAGHWKAVVVGSYERADRAVTVVRLAELAEFYRCSRRPGLARRRPGRSP